MVIFTLLFLSVLLFFVYIFQEKELLSPSVWLIAGYTLSLLVGSLNVGSWGDIRVQTFLVLLLAIISFIFGGSLARFTFINRGIKKSHIEINDIYNFKINTFLIFIMIIFMLVVSKEYLDYTYANSLIGGNPGGWSRMLTYARNSYLTDNYIPIPFFLNVSLKLSHAFAFIMIYIVIHNKIENPGNKIRILEVLPSLIYLVQSLISGGRTRMMYLVLYVFVIIMVLRKNKTGWSTKNNKIIIKWMIISVVIGLSIFWLIDQSFRGSIYNTQWSLWYQISKYIASPVYALDIFLKNPTRMSSFYESETLFPLFSIINKLGGNIQYSTNALDFIFFGETVKIHTNIYTAIRRYVHDYGYLGLIIIQFFMGFIYQYIFEKIKRKRRIGLPLIYFALIIYPIPFHFIEERVMNDIFTVNMATTIFLIFTIWRFVVRKKLVVRS